MKALDFKMLWLKAKMWSLLAGLEWLHTNEQELYDQLTMRLVVVKKQLDYVMKRVREFV